MIFKKPPGNLILLFTILAIFVSAGCANKAVKVIPSTPICVQMELLTSGLSSAYAEVLEVLPSRNIKVKMDFLPNVNQNIDISSLRWSILDKLAEKDNELAKVPVLIGHKEVVYYENRYTLLPHKTQIECDKRKGLWSEKDQVCKSIVRKRASDKEMTLGLKLLNTETKEVEVIAIQTKINIDGVSVVAPNGYRIEIVERPNGIRWNWWNTLYRVISPENTVVIKNNYPRETTEVVSRVVKGKVKKETRKVIKGFLYVLHSEYFEQEENRNILVQAGREYLKGIVLEAFNTLRERGIAVDAEILLPRFFERLPLLEQGDFTEFQLDPQKTVDRVLIILGANRENAWKYTCNGVSACGWVQFTPLTYKNVRIGNPAAKLTVDFREGAGNHLNSMMAAILLHKINLTPLVKKFGEKILNDPRLEEYLAASYNGAPKWAHNSLSATISKGLPDWAYALSPTRKDSRGGLRNETRDFMFKLRYLVEHNLP